MSRPVLLREPHAELAPLAIVVPASYLTTRFGGDYVKLKTADGAVVDAPVQPGQTLTLDGGVAGVEILSGLSAGDVLVQP